MRICGILRLGLALLIATPIAARADVNVVASIKPAHSLVAGVMKGVSKPQLIVEGAGSPHTYALKPSQAAMLEKADLVFWFGHQLETFLEKPLETLATKAKSVELIHANGVVKLAKREGGAFERHEHHDDEKHDSGKASKHDHDRDDKHDAHDEKAKNAHHDDHDDFDLHVWLDPVNAKAFVGQIENALSAADPANAATYKRNADAMIERLDALLAEATAQLKPVKGKAFIVFHDAYRYFETRFDLPASGSITVSPEVMPGARRISELRAKVKDLGVACVFAEPQFEPKLVATVTEGTKARSGVLDPLGAALEDGPDLYFDLIRNMAASFTACLSKTN